MSKFTIEIKWAIIFVLMMIAWMFLENIAGLHDDNIHLHAIYTNFIALPSILIFVLAFRDKRKNYYNGIMSYKQGLITGIIMSVVVAVFSPFIQLIFTGIISPDYFTNVIEYSVSEGKMTREAAESYFNLVSYMWQGALGALMMGVVTSAIVAIFTIKKKK